MNRLQNSIVRFLKFVIELENLIILLNIRSLSSVVLVFARKERGTGRVQQEVIES